MDVLVNIWFVFFKNYYVFAELLVLNLIKQQIMRMVLHDCVRALQNDVTQQAVLKINKKN